MNHQLLTILAAFLLDLVIGDPQWRWHPVRLIGKLIEGLEKKLNIDRFNKLLAGVTLVILVTGATIFCVWASLRLARFIHPLFYYIYSTLLIYFSLSIKAIATEANKIYRALKNKNIKEARNNLSMVVGRDTDKLDEPEIIRATVETVAESTMDGIVAPLFFAFLGGPVLTWAYKTINTLDSMVGYRNEKFIEFGRVAAKLDGLLNFIPAKITCFLIGISGWCYGKDGFSSAKWGLRYLFRGQENNSIATEAAMAGVLGVRLGGLNFYNSVAITKPFVGDDRNTLNITHIKESIKIAYASSLLTLILAVSILYILHR